MCAVIIDPERVVVGGEEGLFCVDLYRNGNFQCCINLPPKLVSIFLTSRVTCFQKY